MGKADVNVMTGTKVPALRFKGFSDEWADKKLGNVLTLRNGYAFKSQLYDENGTYQILTIKNVKGSVYTDIIDSNTISDLPSNIQKHQILSKGDVLISMTGNVGRVSVVNDNNTLLNQRVGLLDINEDIDKYYLLSLLRADKFEYDMFIRGQGAAQLNIGKKDIEGYDILTPDNKVEQQAIGQTFKTIDSLIQSEQDNLEQLNALKKSFLQKMFPKKGTIVPELRFDGFSGDWTWTEKKLGDVLSLYNKKTTQDAEFPPMTSSRSGLYIQDEYFTKNVSSLDTTGYKLLPKGYFTYRSMTDDGNFVFNRNDIIDCGVVSPAYPTFINNDDLITSDFLYYLLNHSVYIKYFIYQNLEGSTRQSLPYSKLSNVDVYVPEIEEQQAIGQFFKTFDELIVKQEEKVENGKTLKKALLQKMFV